MEHADPEVIAIRPEEWIAVERLEPYLRERLHEPKAPFDIAQFGGGHANLTYLLRFGEREYVLRRPPLGPVAERAHDMRREYRVLSRLYRAFTLAPRAYVLCTDHGIIGADFVVEERKMGIAIRRDLPEAFQSDSLFCQRMGEMLVDTLAALHGVDAASVDLGDLGRPDNYVQRQLMGWLERWEAAKTAKSVPTETLGAWLSQHRPVSPAATLVHNDFKLDNLLLDARDPATPTAVLDWDMCTLGDPLMDLGYLLTLWPEAGDPAMWRLWGMPTWRDGFPTRAQAIERYAQKTGFDVSAIEWYRVFNVFRFAVILQQIYQRFERGQTHDQRFASFGEQANTLVLAASALTEHA
jgi:aminoglycoside phosphotransferase (APT) family kinase protein